MKSNRGSILIGMILILQLFIEPARAEYLDPTIRVQKNKQTDLFEKSTGDWQGMEQEIEIFKVKTIDEIKSEQGLEWVAKDKAAVSNEVSALSSIKADELNTRGQEAIAKDDLINNWYLDYNKPLNKQHLVDAKKIADGQDKLLDNLLVRLHEIGVDCKTVKGPKVQEPTYYLQIKESKQKDTVYNQTFCEELRGQYNCSDSVSLTCIKEGMRWNPWKDKEIEIGGPDIYWNYRGWMESIKWKKKRFGIHMRQNPEVVSGIRQIIASRTGMDLNQISEHVVIDRRGVGTILHLERKSYTWEKFIFKYQYRDGYKICEQWAEDWTERCVLK